MKRTLIMLTLGMLVASAAAQSIAERLARIDKGSWGSIGDTGTRCQALFDQLTAKYHVTELELADKIVYITQKLLGDKYGIRQLNRETMEDVNLIAPPQPRNIRNLTKLLVIYAGLRNQGNSREAAVRKLNVSLQLNPHALDSL